MWHKSKMCIAIFFGLFVLGQMSVFAQTTIAEETAYCKSISICGSAPREFSLMLEFTQELINSIRTVGTQGDYLGRFVNPNWFKWAKFDPPQENLLRKIKTNVYEKADFLIATTAIFVSPQQFGGLTDLFAGISTLFKNKVFNRDLQRVDTIDEAVTQKRYEIGLGWWWLEKINQENIDALNTIVKKYQDLWLLTWSSIPVGVKYSDVTAMASKLTAALKIFLADGSTAMFGNVSTSTISINFKEGLVEDLQRQYNCAQWAQNTCDTTYQNFLSTTAASEKSASSRIESALKTFAAATKRLREAFDPNNQSAEFLAREEQLLNAYNGNQKMNSRMWNNKVVTANIDNGGAFSKWRSSAVKSQTQHTNIIDQNKPTTTTTAKNTTITKQAFSSRMTTRMQPMMNQQKIDISLVQFSEVKDFSHYFNQLWVMITKIKDTVIGNKDKDGSLIKELWQACELQCWGTEKKCW